ncbi:regulator of G protein signaling-like protein [Euroglyphus maynei]|uniref:Regulator of G protein signaling-like protein n=1 Tax=Euroglyphus maynei TaxID=6958 RepID=A0A1Y3BUD6_EURMA|nr:regulator of G protein signaling-like protein [Euroglyphus maynei]
MLHFHSPTDGSALFRAFLCREFSDENLEFWLACEEYRKIRSSKLRHRAKKIFDNYVAVRSPRELSLLFSYFVTIFFILL